MRRDLETRSCLRHDLVHWAVEKRAGLTGSFYGMLARGDDPDAYRNAMAGGAPARGSVELLVTEMLVGMLQGAIADGAEPAAFVDQASEVLTMHGLAVPGFLTPGFAQDVIAHYRRLFAQWESLRLGGVLELQWAIAR
jgi:hypothetical protein